MSEKKIKGDVEENYIILENDALVLGNAVETLLDKMGFNPTDNPRVYVNLVENHIEIGRYQGDIELIR